MTIPRTKTAIAHDVAQRINAHLKRLEREEVQKDPSAIRRFYGAAARGERHRVRIVYVSYQGNSYLSLQDAQKYLAWLDAGHVGQHYRVLR